MNCANTPRQKLPPTMTMRIQKLSCASGHRYLRLLSTAMTSVVILCMYICVGGYSSPLWTKPLIFPVIAILWREEDKRESDPTMIRVLRKRDSGVVTIYRRVY